MPFNAARLGFWKQPAPETIGEFFNSSFESGTYGWTVLSDRIRLNGESLILGYPTPPEPDPNPVGTLGTGSESTAELTTSTFALALIPDAPPGGGDQSIQLDLYGILNSYTEDASSMLYDTYSTPAGKIVYGPALYSTLRVNAEVGDTIEFWWRAVASTNTGYNDAYKFVSYLLDSETGRQVPLISRYSASYGVDTNWQYFSKVIEPGEEGNYHFVFINGSWDSTFGYVIGASFLVDLVNIIKA